MLFVIPVSGSFIFGVIVSMFIIAFLDALTSGPKRDPSLTPFEYQQMLKRKQAMKELNAQYEANRLKQEAELVAKQAELDEWTRLAILNAPTRPYKKPVIQHLT